MSFLSSDDTLLGVGNNFDVVPFFYFYFTAFIFRDKPLQRQIFKQEENVCPRCSKYYTQPKKKTSARTSTAIGPLGGVEQKHRQTAPPVLHLPSLKAASCYTHSSVSSCAGCSTARFSSAIFQSDLCIVHTPLRKIINIKRKK